MNRKVFRFTYLTACGKTNVVIETGETQDDARMKARLHIETAHSPMTLKKIEMRRHGEYEWHTVKVLDASNEDE